MLIKDILESLAKEAKLKVRGHPDGKLLRFTGKDSTIIVFVVDGSEITGYRTHGNSKDVAKWVDNQASEKFDLCEPDSLCKILAFMNNDD